jgi:DNA-binding CsgD family transcriptional regulator
VTPSNISPIGGRPKVKGKPRRRRRDSLTLSRAQLEVVELVAKGYSPDRIHVELGIEKTTVKTHILRIAGKIPRFGDLRGYSKILAWVLSKMVGEKTKEAA